MVRLYKVPNAKKSRPYPGNASILAGIAARMAAFPASHRRCTVAALLVWQMLLTPVLLPTSVTAQSASADLTPIAVIQGTGPASSFGEQEVTTWGLVTGVTDDGFYLQDPVGDGDPKTSDGIFAFTYDPPRVTVGECVQVAAEVAEYYAKTELNWLTAITPSASCAVDAVTPVALPTLRPGDDPVVTFEAFEGMVVQLDELPALVHGPTKRFEGGEQEVAFLPLQWQRYFGMAHLFHDQAATSGLLYLSNRLGATLPAMQWGDLLQATSSVLVGVLDYNFGKYQLLLLPDQSLTVTANETVAQSLPPARPDEYGICSFNLHGFGQGTAQFPDPADYDAALRQRAQLIAAQLGGCTVIALQETGSPADAQALAQTLTTEHGLAYSALAIEGPSSYESEFPLTNSILVDSARVTVELTESVAGCDSQDFDIVNPGVCDTGEYPIFDRPPLLAKLDVNGSADAPWTSGETVWVINNHWKSKSGDEVANARLRAAQASAVAERVQTILASDPAAQVVVLGDLNDFYGGETVATLQSATDMFHPYAWLPPLQRYTYIFNGAAQVLDHALVTPNLAPQLSLVEILHIQADTPTGDSPLAHSDHDPVVLRLRPGGAAAIGGTLQWGQIAVSASDNSGNVVAQTVTDANGEYRLWGLPLGRVMLQFSAPAWIKVDAPTQTLTQLVDTTAGMTTPDVPAMRHATAITGAWVALNTPWLADALID